jgi:hypothetical protein
MQIKSSRVARHMYSRVKVKNIEPFPMGTFSWWIFRPQLLSCFVVYSRPLNRDEGRFF